VLPGHLFPKILSLLGVLFMLAGLTGIGVKRSERAPTALIGLGTVLMVLKDVFPLSAGAEDVTECLAALALIAFSVTRWRRWRSGASDV
jgi:hypothetical protein